MRGASNGQDFDASTGHVRVADLPINALVGAARKTRGKLRKENGHIYTRFLHPGVLKVTWHIPQNSRPTFVYRLVISDKMDPVFPSALKSLQEDDPEVYAIIQDEKVRQWCVQRPLRSSRNPPNLPTRYAYSGSEDHSNQNLFIFE